MLNKKVLLGSSSVTTTFSITLVKDVRKHLNVKTGDVVGFCQSTNKDLLITASTKLDTDLTLLGASTLTSSNSVTLPKKVRETLDIQKGQKVAYYQNVRGRVMLEA